MEDLLLCEGRAALRLLRIRRGGQYPVRTVFGTQVLVSIPGEAGVVWLVRDVVSGYTRVAWETMNGDSGKFVSYDIGQQGSFEHLPLEGRLACIEM